MSTKYVSSQHTYVTAHKGFTLSTCAQNKVAKWSAAFDKMQQALAQVHATVDWVAQMCICMHTRSCTCMHMYKNIKLYYITLYIQKVTMYIKHYNDKVSEYCIAGRIELQLEFTPERWINKQVQMVIMKGTQIIYWICSIGHHGWCSINSRAVTKQGCLFHQILWVSTLCHIHVFCHSVYFTVLG